MKKVFTLAVPVALCIAGLLGSLLIALGLRNGTIRAFPISADKLINFSWNMQLMILPLSFAAILAIYFLDHENFRTFFRFDLRGSTEKAEDWRMIGPVFAIALTLGTIMMMSFSVSAQQGVVNEHFFALLPLVLLFALTNAWTEEIISRFVIVAGLHGKVKPTVICFISGGLFGLAHIYGTPSGVFGVLVTGVVGGAWAKSVIDTRSLGWALLIHFLQDVVVFGAGAMVLAKGH